MSIDRAEGLKATYTAHRAELLRFLVARTGSIPEAEDVVQELWLKLDAAFDGPVANARAYLYRMAQNLVIDRVRERHRRARREQIWSTPEVSGTAAETEPVDPSLSVEDAMLEREEIALLASAIQNLPAGARRVFTLHKLEGLGHAEVAGRLGISQSGVEKHMAVAMKHLRRALQD